MKILYAITKSNWGGAQRHVYDLAVAMKTVGHEVFAAVGGEGLLKEKLEKAGIYTYSIGALGRDISVSKDAGSFKELYSIIKEKRPDVLHLHSTKMTGLGSAAGRLLGVKSIIQTIHGWAFNEDRPWYERLAIRIFSWMTMVLCHATVLISKREYDQATRFPFVKKKLKLIALGIKPPVFMSIDGAKQLFAKKISMEFNEFDKKIIVGTIAELHRNKGLPYLVKTATKVIENHPNSLFIVVGEGEERQQLEKEIGNLGLENTIKLLGYVENSSEYLKAFSIFVLPSIKEGLPYTILEAGSASLPVIATIVGGIPEIITDMKSGILVQPKNPKELAHAISFMIEHPEERRAYSSALHEKVLKDFSLEEMIAKTENVYKNDQVSIMQ
jgi:glycosyltransferase involved in cell wall biosynthesis